jgi:alpha-tubulin suppressor-like RCC1 family protein
MFVNAFPKKRTFLPVIFGLYFFFKKIEEKNRSLDCFNDLDLNVRNAILKKNTDVYIWGNGYVNNNTSVYTNFHPHRIKKYENTKKMDQIPKDIIDISFGQHIGACIDKNNNLYAWREPKLNSEKEEGIDNHQRKDVRKLAEGLKVTSITFTYDKLFLLDKNGDVYFYNISIHQPQSEEFFTTSLPEPEVAIVENLIHVKELKNIQQIATGKDHFIALDKHGKLYGMGDDSYGQLGLGNFSQQREQQMKMYNNFIQRRERLPKPIDVNEKGKKIVCGENHTLVLTESGNVYAFGYNRYLQLSNDPLYRQGLIGLNKATIIPADKLKNMKVVDIAASRNCSFFVCKNENNGTYHFFSAGEGLRGQLGQNLIKHMSDVEEMPDISGLINADTLKPFEPMKLKCGLNHCLLLFKNPRLIYLWGNNEFGELGTRDRVFYESPIPMLEEYSLPFNILNFGVGFNSSAFICEKVDPVKKKQILEQDLKLYEEQKKNIKKKKKKATIEEENKLEKTGFSKSLEDFIYKIKKYI